MFQSLILQQVLYTIVEFRDFKTHTHMHTHLTPKTRQKFRCLWIFSCSLHYLGSLSEIFIGLNQMSPPKRVLNISSSSEIHYRPCLGNMYACQVGLLAEGLNGHQWHLITGERRYEQLRSQTYISFYYKFIRLYSLCIITVYIMEYLFHTFCTMQKV